MAAKHITSTRQHYAAEWSDVFQQTDDRACNPKKVTTLAVRRVIPSTGEELQIEITIASHFDSGRTRSEHTSFILSPADADILAAACAKVRAPK